MVYFWAKLNKEELLSHLKTRIEGLAEKEFKERLDKNNLNLVEKGKKKSAWSVFLLQFKNGLMMALVGAAIISLFLGEKIDGFSIILLVFISGVVGFLQEYRAEKTLEKLKKLILVKARVKRDGQWQLIDSRFLVPGDIVDLRLGDIVPADIRLLEVDELSLNEAVLTGESEPVLKTSKKIIGSHPHQLINMAFKGTVVVGGRGKGVVVAIGKDTFFGKIASKIQEEEPATEFQKQMTNFSQFLFKIIMIMIVFVFGVNALLEKGMLDSFLFAVALAVGIAPELMPIIMTITLSQGALRMSYKKVLVKRLMSVEDLGNIDTLCTDKTGTLTEGVFSLVDYQNLKGEKDIGLVVKAFLCTSGEFVKTRAFAANSIDLALSQSKEVKWLEQEINQYKILDENEFDFKRRRMSVLVEKGGKKDLIIKGSVESLAEISLLSEKEKKAILEKARGWEGEGFRVIALGEKEINKEFTKKEDENNIYLVGFLLFNDPIKKSAIKAIKSFKKMGVVIKILSGDSPTVTAWVAKKVGIEEEKVLVGEELENLGEETFEKVIKENNLFARITPEQKQKIVAALNKEGHIVGFLGDGVNDAPAIKAADVGISVNSGSEVAKEAADIILLKKDLSVLAQGIEEGRKIFGNVMKYIFNTLSANFGNMITVSLSSLFLKFIPLLPSQILLNNFLSDIPLFGVATDRVDKDFVKKPKRWQIKTIGRFMTYFGLISSLFDFLMILPMAFIWNLSPEIFRTAWFVESSISEMIITFSLRTKLPFYKSAPGKIFLFLTFLSIVTVIIFPFLKLGEQFFEFVLLPKFLWFWIGIVVGGYFLTTEILKKWFFKKFDI